MMQTGTAIYCRRAHVVLSYPLRYVGLLHIGDEHCKVMSEEVSLPNPREQSDWNDAVTIMGTN